MLGLRLQEHENAPCRRSFDGTLVKQAAVRSHRTVIYQHGALPTPISTSQAVLVSAQDKLQRKVARACGIEDVDGVYSGLIVNLPELVLVDEKYAGIDLIDD